MWLARMAASTSASSAHILLDGLLFAFSGPSGTPTSPTPFACSFVGEPPEPMGLYEDARCDDTETKSWEEPPGEGDDDFLDAGGRGGSERSKSEGKKRERRARMAGRQAQIVATHISMKDQAALRTLS